MARPYPKGFRDDVLRVARNYEDGVTIGQIAADFGVRPMTLSKWLPAEHRGTLDHRRAACRGVEDGVRRGRRPAEGAADGQRTGVRFSSAATVLRRQGRKCPISRLGRRGTTDISNPSTTAYARTASTATIGTPCSTPAWSSATSSTRTTTDTATQRWATERPPSTLRRAGAPTPLWPARSTESGSNKPDSNSGWTWYGDSPGVTATNCVRSDADTTGLSRVILCCDRFRGVLPRRAVAHAWNESPL